MPYYLWKNLARLDPSHLAAVAEEVNLSFGGKVVSQPLFRELGNSFGILTAHFFFLSLLYLIWQPHLLNSFINFLWAHQPQQAPARAGQAHVQSVDKLNNPTLEELDISN